MFSKILKKSSWTDIIVSAVFILFGVLSVAKPEETLGAISIILGVLFIGMGVLKLIEYYTSSEKSDYVLTIALISVIVGVIILFASQSIFAIFRIIIAIWIITVSVMNLQTIFVWKDYKSPYWITSLVLAIVMLIVGIIVLATPNIVMTSIGAILIIYGISNIVDTAIFMKKVDDFFKED